jgi:hypothetical protein
MLLLLGICSSDVWNADECCMFKSEVLKRHGKWLSNIQRLKSHQFSSRMDPDSKR